MRAVPVLLEHGIDPEIIDLVSVNPLDMDAIIESVKKTGRLIVADVGNKSYGVGSEIISRVFEEDCGAHFMPPINLATPDCPCPMAPSLTEKYYPTADTIIDAAAKMFDTKIKHKKRTDFWELHMPPDLNVDDLRKGMK
jgi:pyruvate dehydrogenase E1 component beta subunit